MDVPFFKHSLTKDNADDIAKVLNTPFLTSAGIGKSVEQQIGKYFGAPHSFLVNSWTNGALATLLALGLKPEDEVIVPAMTFIATANVVELLGAKPVFVDIDPKSLLISTRQIEKAITNRTRGIIPVHLYGQMCDMKSIYGIAKENNLFVIEDAAHCFEGSRDGYLPGAYSDAAIFSFYATKNITCGEGGAIITHDSKLAEKIRQTRLHGMSADAVDRFNNQSYNHWDMKCLGVKANLPDILAALLPNQISSVKEKLKIRHKIADCYREAFKNTNIQMQVVDPLCESAEHIFPIAVLPEKRDDAILLLNTEGVQVAVNYRMVPRLSYYKDKYKYKPTDFPVSWSWGEGTITLPMFPNMSTEEQDHVISVVLSKLVPFLNSK